MSETNELQPIPMLLWCPECGERHYDEGEFAARAHHSHACQSCGHVWRPAIIATVGVRFLPGFKNDDAPSVAPAPDLSRACDAVMNVFGEPLRCECANMGQRRMYHDTDNAKSQGCRANSGCNHHVQVFNAPQPQPVEASAKNEPELTAERALKLAAYYGNHALDLSPPLDAEVARYLRAYASQQPALDAKQRLIEEQAKTMLELRAQIRSQEKTIAMWEKEVHYQARQFTDRQFRLDRIAEIARGGK